MKEREDRRETRRSPKRVLPSWTWYWFFQVFFADVACIKCFLFEVRVQRWVFDVHRDTEYLSIDADLTFNRVVIEGFAIMVRAVERGELGPLPVRLQTLPIEAARQLAGSQVEKYV